MTGERTLEQLNQTELSKATKELLAELGTHPITDELYLIQYLEVMQQMWETEMQWNDEYPLTADAAFGVNPILSNTYNLTPEQQYRVITNNLEDEDYLLEMMKTSLKWHKANPDAELTKALQEDENLLTEIFPLTADNLEMQMWNHWEENKTEE